MTEAKRILVIVSMFTRQTNVLSPEDYQSFFEKSLAGEAISVDTINIANLEFSILNNKVDIRANDASLRDYDLVILRGSMLLIYDLAFCISLFCDQESIPCWNKFGGGARSKLAQTMRFAYLQAPVPDSVFVHDVAQLKSMAVKQLGYPFVAKDWYGTKGQNNFLINNEADLAEALAKIEGKDINLIAQQFIQNDGDVRALRIGKKWLFIERRASNGSHLNNTSQGASAQLTTRENVGEEVVALSSKIADEFGCTIAGVDVIFDQAKKPYFLEVNSQPQIVTGAFEDEKTALVREAILDLFNSHQE